MAKKVRVRLPRKTVEVWKPEWEPKVRGWALKYIRENKWRFEHLHDVDDLMQDAYLVFLKVCDSYPRVVDPPHFMSLYKRSLSNFLTDRSREYARKQNIIDESVYIPATEELPPAADKSLIPFYDSGPLEALLRNGPEELRLLIDFIKDDANLVKLRQPQREARGQPRMNIDQRLSSLLGVSSFPFRKVLRQLLT